MLLLFGAQKVLLNFGQVLEIAGEYLSKVKLANIKIFAVAGALDSFCCP